MARLKLDTDMSMLDMIITMSDNDVPTGNILIKSCKLSGQVDPKAWSGQYTFMLLCDSAEIYGIEISMLYDKCNRQYPIAHAAVRAVQMGIIGQRELHQLIRYESCSEVYGKLINIANLVCKQITNQQTGETQFYLNVQEEK